MGVVLIFFTFWMGLSLILSFINIKYGISLFLVYMICVPKMSIQLGGIVMGENIIGTIFLLALFLNTYRHKHKLSFSPFKPFFFYFIIALILLPLSSTDDFVGAFDRWRRDFMISLLLPFIMWNVIKSEPRSLLFFKVSLIIGIIIAIGYGYYQTTIEGLNPYQMALMELDNMDTYEMAKYYAAEGEGRLFGHMSSVFRHPMLYGLFIGLSIIYLFNDKKNIPSLLWYVLFVPVIIMSLICGVRSVLGGLGIVFIYYIFKKGDARFLLSVTLLGLVSLVVISQIPELSDYLGSINASGSGKVSGSSIPARLKQLEGALDEGMINPLFGRGYAWTDLYLETHEIHPICYAFESLIYIIICNWGIIGFFVWWVVGKSFFEYNKKNVSHNHLVLISSIFVFYISYSCITGEYGYMKFFLIFYIIILGSRQLDRTNIITKCDRYII